MTANKVKKYLSKRADLTRWPLEAPSLEDIDQVVVIPALAEGAYLFEALESLACNPVEELARTLVIVVVNNKTAPHHEAWMLEDNQATLERLREFSAQILRLAWVDASSPGKELPEKTGVGLARKIGLDWGLAVLADSPGAVKLLLSLDGDTLVEPNYLGAVRGHFEQAKAWGAVTAYRHQLEGDEIQQRAILCYEAFLRCHVLGLQYAGSPYAYNSVGSTMVCSVEAYVAVSGMNRREAGEDFYFLQELAKTGGVSRITATRVHPSSRVSGRVPFGTGPSMSKYLAGEGGDGFYSPESYDVLKQWLHLATKAHELDGGVLLKRARELNGPLADFLEQNRFASTWDGLQAHSATEHQLRSQFHRCFDGFKTLKLIHYLRDHGNANIGIREVVMPMLERMVEGRPFDLDDTRQDGGTANAHLLSIVERLRYQNESQDGFSI